MDNFILRCTHFRVAAHASLHFGVIDLFHPWPKSARGLISYISKDTAAYNPGPDWAKPMANGVNPTRIAATVATNIFITYQRIPQKTMLPPYFVDRNILACHVISLS